MTLDDIRNMDEEEYILALENLGFMPYFNLEDIDIYEKQNIKMYSVLFSLIASTTILNETYDLTDERLVAIIMFLISLGILTPTLYKTLKTIKQKNNKANKKILLKQKDKLLEIKRKIEKLSDEEFKILCDVMKNTKVLDTINLLIKINYSNLLEDLQQNKIKESYIDTNNDLGYSKINK